LADHRRIGYATDVGNPLDHCTGLPERTLDAGEVVLQEGTPGPLFILVEGAVEILKGALRINVVDERGSIFGEVSALLGTAPMATVRTLERSRFFVADDGLAFIASNPEVAMAVARVLASRLMSVTSYLVDVKRQFEEHNDHLGIVDDVLESLIHDQSAHTDMDRGSDREPDPNA
jgi:CRP/FNR family transcriptional regulator, cyclic AMP receptor protein